MLSETDKVLAVKNEIILVHDEFYNDFYFGTRKQINNFSMPRSQYGTKKQIKTELERLKNTDFSEIANVFLEALSKCL